MVETAEEIKLGSNLISDYILPTFALQIKPKNESQAIIN